MTAWSPNDGAPPKTGGGADGGRQRGGGPTDHGCLPDEELIRRIAEHRDKAAFAQIFERYGARIKGYMIKGGAARDEAEEAAQEALLAVWRRAETFDPRRATAPAWIFAIARNKRIDLVRRAARFEPDTPEDPNLTPEQPVSAGVALANDSRDQTVRAALDALTEEQREVVRLAFYDGCAHSEIAERLGLPLGTVKSRLRLAFGKLKTHLGADFREELLNF